MASAPGLSRSRSERSTAERSGERRSVAIARARAATAALAQRGVSARIVGSLATGKLRPGSDIDFLIMECPQRLKYGIEGIIEDCLGGLPFDVIYLDEVPPRKLARLAKEAVDAGDLR